MTREIKFRAWNKTNKKWVLPDDMAEVLDDEKTLIRHLIIGYSMDGIMQIDSDICNIEVMQYTGLKDKNGKEIFESDLIRDIDSNAVGKVMYVLSSGLTTAAFTAIFKDNSEWGFVPNSKGQDMHCEIIGNIYSNPELVR